LSTFFLLFRKKEKRSGSDSWRTTSLVERTNDATLGKGKVKASLHDFGFRPRRCVLLLPVCRQKAHKESMKHLEADMHSQGPAMFPNHKRVSPRAKNRGVTHATPLSQLAFLCRLTICVLVIGFAAGAQDSPKQQASDGREVSGFLGDYSGLIPDAKNGDLLLYKKDADVLRKYKKFILDPITIYLLPAAQDRGIDPDDMDRMARYFEDAITDELAKSGYEIVTAPGPDVLELNVAITNVEPTGGKKNAAVKGAATAASVAVAPGASLLVPRLSIGKVGIEGEMLDSTSGDRVVAFVTSKGGRRWFSGLNAYKKWGDIEKAFRSWAKEFRERLDEAHGS
jgi:hypothetical protein